MHSRKFGVIHKLTFIPEGMTKVETLRFGSDGEAMDSRYWAMKSIGGYRQVIRWRKFPRSPWEPIHDPEDFPRP